MGPSKQKRCISEHTPDWTLQADTYRRGALMSTGTDFGPIQTDTGRLGAIVSTYELGPSGRHIRQGASLSTGKQTDTLVNNSEHIQLGPFSRHNKQGAVVSTGKQNWALPVRSSALGGLYRQTHSYMVRC